jgi:fucose 4-O-acetylase-like acetyltransferase
VRAGALLLGIVLHGVTSFMPSARDNGAVLADDAPSQAATDLYLFIHLFRMPLFFLVAGFFARLALERRGTGGFVRDRLLRIGLPLVVGCLTLVPLGGWVVEQVAAMEGRTMSEGWTPADTVLRVSLGHLWFLYLLLLFYAAALLLRSLAGAVQRLPVMAGTQADLHAQPVMAGVDACVRRLSRSPIGPLLLAVPAASVLWTYPYWWPSLGVPTPDYTLLPNRPAIVAYGVAFGWGWLLQRQAGLLTDLAQDAVLLLLAAVLFTAGCVGLAGTDVEAQPAGAGARIAYALCYSAAAWYWLAGLVGAAVRWLGRPIAAVGHLAEASYWLYLMHVPVVFALQATVLHWPVHWSLKLLFILTVTTALLLAVWQWLVRPTPLGRLLGAPAQPAAGAR